MSSPLAGSGRPTVTSPPIAAKAFDRHRSARSRHPARMVKTTGAKMSETRLRMTRIPKGADLILNKVAGAPGFWIGNVIVMAVVPSIMQAMLDEVAPKLKIGVRMPSETARADAREGDIGMHLGETRRDRELSVLRSTARAQRERVRDAQKLAQAKRAVEEMLERVRRAQLANLALSRRKQGFESPRERQSSQALVSNADHLLLH